eukprot:9909280-Lingulodinium_polyedra.AAC.1
MARSHSRAARAPLTLVASAASACRTSASTGRGARSSSRRRQACRPTTRWCSSRARVQCCARHAGQL